MSVRPTPQLPSELGSTCGSEHCITCGDDGEPMTVLAIDDQRGVALCSDDDGTHLTVETALVAPVAIGDRLLVHAGTALVLLRSPDRLLQDGLA